MISTVFIFKILHASPGDGNDVDSDAIKVKLFTTNYLMDNFNLPQVLNSIMWKSEQTGILKPYVAATISVADDWFGDGTFIHNSGSVNINGAAAQISGMKPSMILLSIRPALLSGLMEMFLC